MDMKIIIGALIIAALVFVGLTIFNREEPINLPEESEMQLTTDAYENEGRIPVAHTRVEGGEDTPIPFKWEGAPAETMSFALTIIDPHEVANDWVHLMVVNIPSNVSDVYTTTSSFDPSAGELTNSYGDQGYGGPRPPAGTGDHPYVATIYALDTESHSALPSVPSLSFK